MDGVLSRAVGAFLRPYCANRLTVGRLVALLLRSRDDRRAILFTVGSYVRSVDASCPAAGASPSDMPRRSRFIRAKVLRIGLSRAYRCANDAPMVIVRNLRPVLHEARRALRMTQTEFATAVEASQRSVVRWEGGTATPAPQHLANLAALLHPVNRDLASEVAAHAGATLISLNLEAPPPPPAPPVPPVVAPPAPPPARPPAKPVDLVDVLVLAAMLETGSTAPDARRWLHVVMKRARDIGLTIEEAEEGLRPLTTVAAS